MSNSTDFNTPDSSSALEQKLIRVKALLDELSPLIESAIADCDAMIVRGDLDQLVGFLLLNVNDGIKFAVHSFENDPLALLLPPSSPPNRPDPQ